MIRLEMKNCNMTLTEKQQKHQQYYLEKNDKYEYLKGEEILPSDQIRVIEQAKFTYSPLGKAFENQTKTIQKQGRKQIDSITNQNERLATLTNKNDHKDNYKEIFEELVTERFDEITELANERNHDDLTY